MEKSELISEWNANSLFWLGRYVQRVYLTLHLLRKCYDRMIDGSRSEYDDFWKILDADKIYERASEFREGMMYDESNAGSVYSSLQKAMDNAMLLRQDISSETLSYLEMSVAKLKKCKEAGMENITDLQQITDWSMAFWGSAEQKMSNHKMLNLMLLGRNVENMDMLLRFNYSPARIAQAFESIEKCTTGIRHLIDEDNEAQLKQLVVEKSYDAHDKAEVLSLVNTLARV